jgi:hypothetical protein
LHIYSPLNAPPAGGVDFILTFIPMMSMIKILNKRIAIDKPMKQVYNNIDPPGEGVYKKGRIYRLSEDWRY